MILVDTGLIAAFFNSRDVNHARAVELMDNLRQGKYGIGIITDYILDETVTLLFIRSKRKELSLKAGNLIMTEQIGKFFPISLDLIKKTWDKYQRLINKGLSFTDCSLLVVGEFLGCNDILSFSKEFNGLMNRLY